MSDERIADGWYVMTRPNSGDDILQRVEDGCIDDGTGAFARTLAERGYIFRPVEIIPAEERKRWHDINATQAARIAELEQELVGHRRYIDELESTRLDLPDAWREIDNKVEWYREFPDNG